MGLTVDNIKTDTIYNKRELPAVKQEQMFDCKTECTDIVELTSKSAPEEEESDWLLPVLTGVACAALMGFLHFRGIKNNKIYKSLLHNGSSNYGVIRAMEPKNFNKIKALSPLSKEERLLLNRRFEIGGASEQDIFFATLKGDKPSCIVSLPGKDLEFIGKVNTRSGSGNFDFLHIPDEVSTLGFILNKNKVLDVIGRNKNLYTTRLNLDANVSSEAIYQKLTEVLQKDYLAYHDLTGVTLGFSPKNSMIFELSRDIPFDVIKYDSETFKVMLLDKLRSPNSPYKNLSQSELKELTAAIESYKPQPSCLPENDLYFFKTFVNEPEDFARIAEDSSNFAKNFKAKDLF